MSDRRVGVSRLFNDKLVLAVCVLISLGFLSMGESQRLRWARSMAHQIVTPVEWFVDLLDGVANLKSENQELRSRLAALELDLHQLAAERAQLEDLEERAGFYERSRGHIMPATVLEVLIHRFPVQAKIRSFSETDTLEVWQPVVTSAGLVGRIREVLSPQEALVQLLTDEESRISVEVVGTGVLGLLRYDGRRFQMDQVPQAENVNEGSLIQTSGLGGTVPKGLPIGTVASVQSIPTELFQRVEVDAAVRFSALSDVYVVVRPGPWYSRLTGVGSTAPDSTRFEGARR